MFATTAHADDAAVNAKLRKGPICDAVAGTGNVHGKLTIATRGNGDGTDLHVVTVTGFVNKIGMRKLWNVYLRQVTDSGNIDTQIGFAWTGKKTRGKFDFSVTYALVPGTYQLQVLFAKALPLPAKTPDDCPGVNPMSYKTDVVTLVVS